MAYVICVLIGPGVSKCQQERTQTQIVFLLLIWPRTFHIARKSWKPEVIDKPRITKNDKYIMHKVLRSLFFLFMIDLIKLMWSDS